ncbi:MAG: glycosyltransferase, partial [Candidatus Omnitrophica bacterium]|nr:glycosyltransferase [Candidatus Omnitrophota bacterium]
MRIAIFSWESMHSICVGGVGVHVSELASALERKGNEVHVFTRMGGPNQPWYERIYGVHYHRCQFDRNDNFVEEINKLRPGGRLKNQEYYFLENITYSALSSGLFSARHNPPGFLFD